MGDVQGKRCLRCSFCSRSATGIRQVSQSFGGDAEAKLVDSIRGGGFVEVSLVAETESQVIAHILFEPIAIITIVGTVDALSLVPMAVMPEYQRTETGRVWLAAGSHPVQGSAIGIGTFRVLK